MNNWRFSEHLSNQSVVKYLQNPLKHKHKRNITEEFFDPEGCWEEVCVYCNLTSRTTLVQRVNLTANLRVRRKRRTGSLSERGTMQSRWPGMSRPRCCRQYSAQLSLCLV